ncbi:GspE/PulE family protein, partial [Planctomycetota bacterium]
QVGFDAEAEQRFRSLVKRPHGIILITGPTGSGKTTTLYAALTELNSDNRNIMTVEDPIEYRLEGIGQMQVRPKIELTFASCLRHILRQDPDVIMIGEIRDLETARIAIQAALTGHLVLSTLHTNDAPSAVTRLIDMGVEPYLVSSSVLAIMAQRLVRRICGTCGGVVHARDDEPLPEDADVCTDCSGTGYRGRMGIFELITMDDDIRDLILKDSRAHVLRQMAIEKGMHTLREDGMVRVELGHTTPEEVMRVTQDDMDA